jgi:hypothetical protein
MIGRVSKKLPADEPHHALVRYPVLDEFNQPLMAQLPALG